MNNEEILAALDAAIKGITTQTTLGSSVLEPYQFDRFVRVMLDKTVVLPEARFMAMDSKIVDIDRIAFADRVMKPRPAEGTEVSSGDFVAPAFDQHKLTAVGMRGVVSLTDQVLRNNPERQALMTTVMDMIGQRSGLDIEEQGIKGDTGSSDTFLALNDGWLKLTRRRVVEDALKAYDDVSTASFSTGAGVTTATVYYDKVPILGGTFEIYTTSTSGTKVADEDGDGVIDAVGGSGISGSIDYESGKIVLAGLAASTSYYVKYTAEAFDNSLTTYPESAFSLMIKAIPKPYFDDPSRWRLYVPWSIFDLYLDRLRARGTPLGDQFQTGAPGLRVWFKGVQVVYAPKLPINRLWLTHPDNTIYGVFNQVEVETERMVKAKRTDIVVDADVDYGFEEPEATVVGELS